MNRGQRAALNRLGPARMQPYLADAGGAASRAVDLYAWNSAVAAAFWTDLGHLEVFLRNVLDARMIIRHSRLGRVGDWLDDPTGELGRDMSGSRRPRHRQPFKDIDAARGRVRTNHKPVGRDQTISETTFGLWHQLVAAHQRFLWPDLAAAFPHAPSRAQHHVGDPLARLRSLRNRIAHHHRIVGLDLVGRHEDIGTLLRYIDPVLRDWVDGASRVSALLGDKP